MTETHFPLYDEISFFVRCVHHILRWRWVMYESGSKNCPWRKEGEVFLAYVVNAVDAYDLGYKSVRVDLEHVPTDDEGKPMDVQYCVFVSEEEWIEKNGP